jgi:hypothetical protein
VRNSRKYSFGGQCCGLLYDLLALKGHVPSLSAKSSSVNIGGAGLIADKIPVFPVSRYGAGCLIEPFPVRRQRGDFSGAKKLVPVGGGLSEGFKQTRFKQNNDFMRQESQNIRSLMHVQAGRQAWHE